ncbi:MAG: 16S rRNA (adenine(1518)-N(6)/adenine(1519)-N(6))-dimethyltransferase RsmA [Deltaproteobacteria bacterium]|nr:16S rRNA (adenine(1518)-N(6)/adenine(1519)-N(6))-dimethyltransferase RsmA [Deltaproteobacteria bacterium]
MMDYGDFEDPRGFLSRHGLWPKDSFGQNFLVAPPVAQSIVKAVDPREDEHIIEVGTGPGTLAKMLAPRAKHVLAIERDREMVAALRAETLAPNIEILEADAAQFDYAAACAKAPTSIVGNLPYQITGRLLRVFLAPPVQWRVAVLMVQKEVALRLCAVPGGDDWGVLSVFTQAACTVTKVCDASPRCFHPAPRVVSTVVRLTPRPEPLARETEAFAKVVHAVFAARRKTVLNGLAPIAPGGKDAARAALAAVSIDPQLRPETLSIQQLGALTEALFGTTP